MPHLSVVRGPAGGEWVLCKATMRDVPYRCVACGALVSSAWSYYVGLVSHATVCEPCADGLAEASS